MVSATYTDTQTWARMAIHNIASSGKFSSDRLKSCQLKYLFGNGLHLN
jgi:glucan phosphorylase